MHRDLVERAMAGDHDAFSELTRGSVTKLYAIARLIVRDNDQAEDATQETLVAAWRQLRSLRDPDRFDAWLRRLLIRACYREAGKRQHWRRLEAQIRPFLSEGPDPGIAIADRDELERGFGRLSPEQRALVVLAAPRTVGNAGGVLPASGIRSAGRHAVVAAGAHLTGRGGRS